MKRQRRSGKSVARAREIELLITALGFLGDGRGSVDGREVLVPFTLPGERWRVALESGRGRVLRGRALEPLAPLERPPAICAHFGDCGGCALQHLDEASYDTLKRARITTALRHRGVAAPALLPTIMSPPASRRRLRLAFDGQGRLGLRQRGGHRLVAMRECPIAMPAIVAALPALREWTRKLNGVGELLVTATDGGLDLLLLAANRPGEAPLAILDAPDVLRLAFAQDSQAHPEILWQRAEPVVSMAGTAVALPPGAFLQATATGEAALQAFALAQLRPASRVADYFCGLGTLSLAAVAAGHEVQAFDVDGAAVRALRRAGGLSRAESVDLFRAPPAPRDLARLDAAILDPPRAGAEALIATIAASKLARVIYASCDPKSFARDAATLATAGFTLEAIQPIDQFRYSAEIELIAALARR